MMCTYAILDVNDSIDDIDLIMEDLPWLFDLSWLLLWTSSYSHELFELVYLYWFWNIEMRSIVTIMLKENNFDKTHLYQRKIIPMNK